MAGSERVITGGRTERAFGSERTATGDIGAGAPRQPPARPHQGDSRPSKPLLSQDAACLGSSSKAGARLSSERQVAALEASGRPPGGRGGVKVEAPGPAGPDHYLWKFSHPTNHSGPPTNPSPQAPDDLSLL